MVNLKVLARAFDIEQYLGRKEREPKHYSGNMVVTCPRCEKPKLWVLVADRGDVKRGSWQCFLCEESGRDAVSLVRFMEDCTLFRALQVMTEHQRGMALVDLRALVLEKLDGVSTTEAWDDRIEPVPLPEDFMLAAHADAKALRYFKERGIGPKKAARFGLGVCRAGFFRDRMIVPVRLHGEVLFFVARYLKATPPAGVKKVVYPKGSRPGRVLFNYDRAKTCRTIRIVEGALDAVAVGKTAVATFGTSLSQYQLELLLQTAATEVIIWWDADAYDKAVALAHRLSEFWRVRVVRLPDARDPDEYTKAARDAMEAESPVWDEREAFKARIRSKL